MTTVSQVFRHICTCKDNVSFDMAKVAGVYALFALTIFTGFDVFINKAAFEIMNFGAACTTIITGTCVGVLFKKDTEPNKEEDHGV